MAEKLFSERSGIIPEKPLQIDNIDQDLKNRIWSILFVGFFDPDLEEKSHILRSIWTKFLKQPIDETPSSWNRDSHIYKDIFLVLIGIEYMIYWNL